MSVLRRAFEIGSAAAVGAVAGAVLPFAEIAVTRGGPGANLALLACAAACAFYGAGLGGWWNVELARRATRPPEANNRRFGAVCGATLGAIAGASLMAIDDGRFHDPVIRTFEQFIVAIPVLAGIMGVLGAALGDTVARMPRSETTKRTRAAGVTGSDWSDVAAQLGLTVVRAYRLDRGAIEGSFRGSAVSIRTFDDPEPSTRYAVAGLPADMSFGPSSGAAGDAVATGDAAFDAVVVTSGDPGSTLPMLDETTREEIRAFIERTGATIQGGNVERTVSGSRVTAREIEKELDALTRFFTRLAGRAALDPKTRLREIVERDPSKGVRRRALELLAERHGGTDDTLAAARACRADPDLELRFTAALALGGEGRPSVEEILASNEAPEELRLRALETLALLPDSEPAIVRALGTWIAPVRLAAIDTLAAMGTPAAVMPLRAIGGAQRKAAEHAIARIQARIEGAGAGQLSVARSAGGELALGGAEGALTPVDRPNVRAKQRT